MLRIVKEKENMMLQFYFKKYLSQNTYEQEEKADWEFLRLSLPVTCNDRFISEHEKARRWHEYQVRQGRAQGQQRRNAAGQPIPPDRQRRPSAQIGESMS